MKHEEQKFCTELQLWLKYNWEYSGPIEVKVSYEPKFNLKSGFRPHQLQNLINCWEGEYCITYKISDEDRREKPWDLCCYRHAYAMVAIKWIGKKEFYLIHPMAFQRIISEGKKSIDETWARRKCFVSATLH